MPQNNLKPQDSHNEKMPVTPSQHEYIHNERVPLSITGLFSPKTSRPAPKKNIASIVRMIMRKNCCSASENMDSWYIQKRDAEPSSA